MKFTDLAMYERYYYSGDPFQQTCVKVSQNSYLAYVSHTAQIFKADISDPQEVVIVQNTSDVRYTING
jgi:hypothetical protein